MCRGELYLEQEIPGDPEKNHPDLVVINRSLEKAIVVDVTIPFEGENNQGDQVQCSESLVADAIKGGGGDCIHYWSTGLLGP